MTAIHAIRAKSSWLECERAVEEGGRRRCRCSSVPEVSHRFIAFCVLFVTIPSDPRNSHSSIKEVFDVLSLSNNGKAKRSIS